MKKSIPLSVMVAGQSPAPKSSFLFNSRRTWVMGVLNATPDSFYAGSRVSQTEAGIQAAGEMISEGADVLDIGGESTRPGAGEVSLDEELSRILPILDALRSRWPDLVLSIDTQKAGVARHALAHGVNLINDISAMRADPEMADVVAESASPLILMHMQGTPQTMQTDPRYDNVVDDVKRFFEERLSFAVRQSIPEDRIILDPGIGFGKTLAHNMTLLKHLSEFLSLGRPLLVGVSRKSFIGRILGKAPSPQPSPEKGEGEDLPSPFSGEGGRRPGEGSLPPEDRLEGSLAAALWAVRQGARGLRVHDVRATRRAIQMWEGIQRS